MTSHFRGRWLIAFLAFALIWLALFFYAAAGVRGSDQYWYVAEVQAVIAGDPRTNSLWPHFLLSDPDYATARPFVHQGLMPYLVGALGTLFGAYDAWMAFNLVATLLTTGLIYRTLRDLQVDTRIALSAAGGFLLLPITLWHATQPLVEITVATLAAALVAVAVRPMNPLVKFLLLMAVAMAGQQVITIFLPVLIAIPAAFLWTEWFGPDRRRSPSRSLFYLLVPLPCLWLLSLKASTLGFSVSQLMMNGTVGGTNMDLWLREEDIPFSASAFAGKVLGNFRAFLALNTNQIFFFPALALVLANFVGFFRSWRAGSFSANADRPALQLFYIFGVAILVYGIVVTLHQNQARYLLYILPVLIVVAAWLYREFLGMMISHWPRTIAGGGVALIALGVILSMTLRADSAAAAKTVADLRGTVARSKQLSGAKAWIECYRSSGDSLQLAYAFPTKLVVHVDPAVAAPQLARLAERTGASLLLCSTRSIDMMRKAGNGPVLTKVGTIGTGEMALEVSRID